MDVLSDIFETIRLRGTFYFRTHFSAPWGTTVPRLGRAARFHYVARGQCYITVEGQPPVLLQTDDFVIVPAGASHILSHDAGQAAPPLEEVLTAVGYDGERLLALGKGDEAASTQLVCGHFTVAEGGDHPLLRALPPIIVISNALRRSRPWFDQVLTLLVNHVFQNHDGAEAVVTRLSEVLFIEAIRSAGKEAPGLQRIVEAFSDPHIGHALQMMHRDPAREWTVEDLALAVGMSRTRFAGRFHDVLGVGPIGYLTEWRLQRAAQQLRNTRQPIALIARANGYASPASFSRAFSEQFGVSPREWRQRGTEISG